MVLRPWALASVKILTVAVRTAAASEAVLKAVSSAASTAAVSKIAEGAQMMLSGGAGTNEARVGLEASAAEGSWCGVNLNYLIILNGCDRKAALVCTIAVQAEDTVNANKPRAACERLSRKRL